VEKGLEVIAKNWRDFNKRLKPILKKNKSERDKEKEQNMYLDGIKQLVHEIQMERDISSSKPKKDDTPEVNIINKPGQSQRKSLPRLKIRYLKLTLNRFRHGQMY